MSQPREKKQPAKTRYEVWEIDDIGERKHLGLINGGDVSKEKLSVADDGSLVIDLYLVCQPDILVFDDNSWLVLLSRTLL